MNPRKIFTKENLKKEAKEWAQSLVWALVLTLIIRTFVIQAFKIPSGSMRLTLVEGDKLFVNKFIYRFEEPQRGDIVVFKYPEDPKKDFIKRLVALEGETIEIRDGSVYVNDRKLTDPETFAKFYYFNQGPYGVPGEKVTVPADHYYVLGDNSAYSRDSRWWGFVPKKNVIGKALVRWWPPTRIGSIRPEPAMSKESL